MIDRIKLIRNIGQFDSVATGDQLPFSKLTLLYAENGRGKTTLAAILRSLATSDPVPVLERQRLASSNSPHIVVAPSGGGAPAVFQNGTWSRPISQVVIFDDLFVAENVYAGLEVQAGHRQHLHELILGAQGIALSRQLQGYVDRIEEHNRALRAKADAIPDGARGSLTVDAFCDLAHRPDADEALVQAERNLAAAREADSVRAQPEFDPLTLPELRLEGIRALLQTGLSGLDATAAARVQAHIARLGPGGESWIGDGMHRIQNHACPFCGQELTGSQLIEPYRQYFSTAYEDLKRSIATTLADMRKEHSGEVIAAFERSVRVAVQRRQFWSRFADVPDVMVDTAAVARAWKAAQEDVLAALEAKRNAPLEPLALPADAEPLVDAYREHRRAIEALSHALQNINPAIALVKERAEAGNVSALAADLANLRAIQNRYRPDIAPLCEEYLAEKAAKAQTEALRETTRAALDQYRQQIFSSYEVAINSYLQRFNAGFRLAEVTAVNTRGGSACSYNVQISNTNVPLTAGETPAPSFRNAMSAGDRNTLALAFFFASLDQDPQRTQKIVIIDDPMTSLDENRSLTTVQEIRRLTTQVDQVIVLSHSKPFLLKIWEGAEASNRAAMTISRAGPGSTLAAWDVEQERLSDHDKRYAVVRAYIDTGNTAHERKVAEYLRPLLEAYVRVAYPETFRPGSLLGPFLGIAEQRKGTPQQILSAADITELRDLLEYANKFHHETNPTWETEIINGAELTQFARRVLAFIRRP